MKICILSSINHIGKIKEDSKLQSILSKQVNCDILAWEIVTESDIKLYDLFVVRSVWGYHKSYSKFIELLSKINESGKILINGYNNILENISKQSQYELFTVNNIPTIPTIFLRQVLDQSTLITTIKQNFGLNEEDEVIFKPAISASGNDLVKVKVGNIDLKLFASVFDNDKQSICIQPFINDVKNGEFSAIIVNNELQYIVKRFPGVVTEEKHVELLEKVYPNLDREISNIIRILKDKNLSFYRIDFFMFKGNFYVNELEIIDPDLFTRKIEDSISNYCLENLASTILKITNVRKMWNRDFL